MSAAGENKRQEFNYLAYDTVLQLLVFVPLLLFICCMGEQCQKLFHFFFDGLWVPASIVKLFCRRHRNISVSHYGLVEKQSLSNRFLFALPFRRRVGPSRGEKKSEARNLGCANKFLRLRLFRVYKIKFLRLLVLADSSTGFAVEYLAFSLTHFIPLWLNMKLTRIHFSHRASNYYVWFYHFSVSILGARDSSIDGVESERLTESSSELFALSKSNHIATECSGRVLIAWHYMRSKLTAAAVQFSRKRSHRVMRCHRYNNNLSSGFRSWFRLPCRSEFVLITQTERQIRF